jgi:hypothetical protein
LKRATIFEKWWHDKIKKEVKQSEKLQKEVGPGEIEEGLLALEQVLGDSCSC